MPTVTTTERSNRIKDSPGRRRRRGARRRCTRRRTCSARWAGPIGGASKMYWGEREKGREGRQGRLVLPVLLFLSSFLSVAPSLVRLCCCLPFALAHPRLQPSHRAGFLYLGGGMGGCGYMLLEAPTDHLQKKIIKVYFRWVASPII